eukprot:CAMPEP_0170584164 /NCGR_PEP_ID=MMETSP0224-20130122/8542_1 /TAXON_ID=285029 /ORGANISM="Togula jolla, Strain CCCM 725" /LENGTH=247 /DNA_ID=CAMNT_0010907579 /DNA_START=490 /DNA_END=1233 /DNA_ORIENTATION=+
MAKGLRRAARAVASSCLVLSLNIYVFAIVLYEILGNEPSADPWFRTLPLSMWTLLVDGTLLDNMGIVVDELLRIEAFHAVTIFMMFTLLSAMLILNMLIGVLCEVVSGVAALEKEEAAIDLMKRSVLGILKRLDADGTGEITEAMMEQLTDDPLAIEVLYDLQVDVDYLMEIKDMMISDPARTLTITEVMDLILSIRGDRSPLMKDMVGSSRFLTWKINAVTDQMEDRIAEIISRMLLARPEESIPI